MLVEIDPRPYQVTLGSGSRAACERYGVTKRRASRSLPLSNTVAGGVIARQQVDTQQATVGQYDGAIQSDEAQINSAKLQLAYSRITSPITGRVGLRLVDPGNIVHATDANGMLVITQVQPIAVIFTLPEDGLGQVVSQMKRQPLKVEAYSRDNKTKLEEGKLLTIDNQIDQTTGTIKLKSQFDNPNLLLWPNQFVNIRLFLSERKNALVIPSAAIQTGSQGSFVYLVGSDNKAQVRPVQVDFAEGNISVIRQGLAEKDQIVVDGAEKLQAGALVTPHQSSALSNPNASPELEFVAGPLTVSPSKPFILRPVATSLLMVGVMLAGMVAYLQLPVSALPQVDYPTIQVVTFYPGANPDVMASAVTTPLERQFGELPGLAQMTSTSSLGGSVITLQFDLKEDIDVAEQEVQAAINAASTYLPRDLPNPPIYSKVNPADTPILTLALTSDTLPLQKVEDFADTNLAQKISQLSGVGLVTISGGQKPAVRVQANPTALASYGLSLEDLRTALGAANVDQAKGNLNGPRQSFTIQDNDQLLSSEAYRPLVIAYRNGGPVRLSDVATVTDSSENATQAAWMNTKPAVILNIQRQPGANIIGVANRVKTLLPRLQASLPSSMRVTTLTDMTTTIRASVSDVQFELMLTIGLVVMVMFLFLRSLSATIIPSVAVPLSIVGTFGVMYLAGYSLDNLSLMALTISTGFVVDDAIVMIENIARFIEDGDSPLEAALKGSEQIGFTIVSLTVSLIAVLIPLLFMGDIIGRLFREFAVTLGATILVSAFVSLTLTPMMSAKLLHREEPSRQGKFYKATGHFFDRMIAFYGRTLQVVLRHQTITLMVTVGTLASDIPSLLLHSQGIFSRTGHGSNFGHFGGSPVRLVFRHGPEPTSPCRGHFGGSRRGQSVFVHRSGWHEHNAE